MGACGSEGLCLWWVCGLDYNIVGERNNTHINNEKAMCSMSSMHL